LRSSAPMLQLMVALTHASVLSPGSKVVIAGAGPVCYCAAKLAALGGFETTALMYPQECEAGPGLIYNDKCPQGSLPLTFVPIAGPDAEEATIEALCGEAEGVILAIDGENVFGASVLETFIKPGLKRVSVMSRYLNGAGMGFFANSAKFAANKDIWAGGGAVEAYTAMEKAVIAQAAAVGAEHTIIRAGTLKGGASGSALSEPDGGGEVTLLNPEFYKMGQQDVANWRLLYDTAALAVKIVPGDTLPGPGASAVFTALEKVGSGDSHRGAVAASLVEALRVPETANRDFSIAAEEGRQFPTEAEWASKFAAAAASSA